MGVIVVVWAALRFTVSEAKTEVMCLRTKGMPESTTIFSVEAADWVYNQTIEFVYLRGNANHNDDLFIVVNRRTRNVWCSFPTYTFEQPVRPTEGSPRAQNLNAKSQGPRDSAVWLSHMESARMPLRHVAPSPT